MKISIFKVFKDIRVDVVDLVVRKQVKRIRVSAGPVILEMR